ncbi:hypothetical protein ACH5RR_037757 [Cinchona calisaya]|uniref:S-locus glycoprotein domain-containing protein n=1 Tax=Cinchona calisaya TaxID=153742 RepID=A0ABD2Y731_9GENT
MNLLSIIWRFHYNYKLVTSTIIKFTVSPVDAGQCWTWDNQSMNWLVYLSLLTDNCDRYGLCGAYGSCNIGNSATCGCLDKFLQKNPDKWANGDLSNGCIRRVSLDCRRRDGFVTFSGLKLPDTHNSSYNSSICLEECRRVPEELFLYSLFKFRHNHWWRWKWLFPLVW